MTAAVHALPASRAEAVRLAATGPLHEWLETQARLVAAWRDRLVAESGDMRLIAVLDQHAAFLAEAREAF